MPVRKGTFNVWVASGKTDAVDVDVDVIVRFILVRPGKEVYPSVERLVLSAANTTTAIVGDKACPASIPDLNEPKQPPPPF